MLNNMIEDNDVDKLIKKVKDKTKSSDLVSELQDIKNQGYPVSVTFAKIVQHLENSFEKAVNTYKGYGHLMSQPNYIKELNRGGGKDLHRQIGLILKKEIYNNPRYLGAGNFKMLQSVSELNEIPKQKILLRKVKQTEKSLFSKIKKKMISPIKHAIRKRF